MQKWRKVVFVLTAQREQVSETLGKERVYCVSRCAERDVITLPWEADVLPLHHSREKYKIEHCRQCIRLFAALQLILFNCIDLHPLSPQSGGRHIRLAMHYPRTRLGLVGGLGFLHRPPPRTFIQRQTVCLEVCSFQNRVILRTDKWDPNPPRGSLQADRPLPRTNQKAQTFSYEPGAFSVAPET